MPNERESRKPTDAEVALWSRILDGMLVDDKGFVSSHKAAFRAWCLTVIMQYTDWLTAPAEGDVEVAKNLANYLWNYAEELLGKKPDISRRAVIDTITVDIAAALTTARKDAQARVKALEAAAGEAKEYLDKISDDWENSPTDTTFNHDLAHKAYLISEKLNAAPLAGEGRGEEVESGE